MYLLRGFPGHPLHPPMTDAAIGAYTAATVLAALGASGVAEEALAKGWWITLLVGLGFGGLAALTGLVEWLSLSWGTPLWRTATFHMLVMVVATLLFVLAAIVGYGGYEDGEVRAGALALVLPLALTALMGTSVSLTVTDIPIVVQDFDQTPLSRRYADASTRIAALQPRLGQQEHGLGWLGAERDLPANHDAR